MRLRAIALLRDHLGVEEDITDATTLFDQLNADSLDRIEAGMALEEEFGLTIPDEAIQKWSTVGDVLDWLRKTTEPAETQLTWLTADSGAPLPGRTHQCNPPGLGRHPVRVAGTQTGYGNRTPARRADP